MNEPKQIQRFESVHSSPNRAYNGLSAFEKPQVEKKYARNVDLDDEPIDRRLSEADLKHVLIQNSDRKVCSEEDKVDEDGNTRRVSTTKHKGVKISVNDDFPKKSYSTP